MRCIAGGTWPVVRGRWCVAGGRSPARKQGDRDLINHPLRLATLRAERKPLLSGCAAVNQRRHMFPHHGSMLESVAGSAPYQPDIGELRMPVNQKITARCILVLANARFHQWRSSQRGKPFGHKRASYI